MKISLRSRTHTELHVGLICTVLGAGGFAVTHLAPELLDLIHPCLFRAWTGIPCPACGATRAGIHLSHFRLTDALKANPLFTLLFIGLAFWGGNSVIGAVTGKNVEITLTTSVQRKVFIAAFLVNWLYLILTTLLK